MRGVRWALVAGLAFAVACQSGDTTVTPSESEASSEVSAASETPSAEPTESPSAGPSEEPSEDTAGDESATTLFARLPKGYSYTTPPKAARQQLATQLGGVEDNPIIADVETKFVERGSAPVAAVIAVRFSDQAGPGDLRGFAKGVAQGAGGRPKPATVGGKHVTFIQANTAMFLYRGDGFALLFFGTTRPEIQPIVAGVLKNLD